MSRKRIITVGWLSFAFAAAFVGPLTMQAQDSKSSPSTMAPLEQYLMDRDAEIALARSAAPESISREAKILVLGRHGYETAVEGTNGFVCVVERSWMSPLQTSGAIDSSAFWNPKIRGPLCFNPQAARSILPITYKGRRLYWPGRPKLKSWNGRRKRTPRRNYHLWNPARCPT